MPNLFLTNEELFALGEVMKLKVSESAGYAPDDLLFRAIELKALKLMNREPEQLKKMKEKMKGMFKE